MCLFILLWLSKWISSQSLNTLWFSPLCVISGKEDNKLSLTVFNTKPCNALKCAVCLHPINTNRFKFRPSLMSHKCQTCKDTIKRSMENWIPFFIALQAIACFLSLKSLLFDDDHNTEIFHVFEIRIGMNEFDHRFLALLKQLRLRKACFFVCLF